MTKKIFAVILTISLMLFTTCVFANNDMGDAMNGAANTARDFVGGAENVVEDAAGAIGTGVKDLGNTFAEGAARVTNSGDSMANGSTSANGDYTATRTATTRAGTSNTILGMGPTAWTWFILAIATIAIVGLVWYYGMQHQDQYDENNNR